MRIAARFGNSLHAPANSQISLISAYTSGADALDIMLQFTKDNKLVLSGSDSIKDLTGEEGNISGFTVSELLGFDFSENFSLRNSPGFSFYKKDVKGRRLPLAELPHLLRLLPPDLFLLIQMDVAGIVDSSRRKKFIEVLIETVAQYKLKGRCILYSEDAALVTAVTTADPSVRVGLYNKSPNSSALDALSDAGAAAFSGPLNNFIDQDMQLTALGKKAQELFEQQDGKVDFVLHTDNEKPALTAEQFAALQKMKWVWAISTGSVLDIEQIARKGITLVDEAFKGNKVDKTRFSFGYAKANKYAHVFQDDGVHIDIKPYDGKFDEPKDAVQKKITRLENKLTYTAKDWPYYSGGGVGVLEGLQSDFVAEVDYTVETVTQATTLEMAVVNADPGSHRDEIPTSVRHKDSFFDPHGAPPFAGVEHDEDDGYRINWNLGTEYDNNQYGRPVGNGWDAHAGSMRLERRGAYFSAYYRNETDAHDWVCVGVARNDSLNPCVYLRCVAKRWRQENEKKPDEFMPIIPNHFVFKNLKIKLYV